MFVFATVCVVVALVAAVVFVPSERPARRLVLIIRAWRSRP